MRIWSQQETGRGGFSLVEIILAIGVFALTIVAVLAMLGSSSQATADVLNTATASQIADAIRSELEGVDFQSDLVSGTSGGPVLLYGTKDGRRVVIAPNADNPPNGDPPGIPRSERFFLVTVDRLGNELAFDVDNAHLALSVRLEWPYNVPLDLSGTQVRTTDRSRRSVSIFNVSIPRTF